MRLPISPRGTASIWNPLAEVALVQKLDAFRDKNGPLSRLLPGAQLL